jgi:hypothetical protein
VYLVYEHQVHGREGGGISRRAWRRVKSANGAEIIGRQVHGAATQPSGARTCTLDSSHGS